MSQEPFNPIAQPKVQPQEALVDTGATDSVAQDAKRLFSDGEHVIPAWMVAHMGGEKTMDETFSKVYQTVTFADFARAFMQDVQADNLRKVQHGIIRQHFMGARRGY